MGYHLRQIARGVLGEPSKIREELEEFEDALAQNNRIMAAVELSDLLGATKAAAEKLGFTLQDLITMHEANERAFKDGTRKSR